MNDFAFIWIYINGMNEWKWIFNEKERYKTTLQNFLQK
jgi:hypothetical protein